MAENKKSFIMYLTQRPTFDGLSDEDAGKLIKTIFSYVCDENPQPTGIVKYAFEIIKPVLKADLVKYEDKRMKLKENISKRWNTNKNEDIQKNTNEYNSIQNGGVIVNDIVIDNVIDNDNDVSKDTNKNNRDINISCSKPSLSDSLFNRFWDEYPRKVGKDKCLKWFKSHKVDEELLNKMLDTVKKFKNSNQWCKDNGQYIPHPYTWLSRGGWEDELKEDSFTSSNNIEVVWEEL